ncbi:hypothetical protein [Mycobacterium sp.]|uniref:hypothetical protein n=1 Tax=Mycobacterium sp. TaxID=1785 RepID=UPI002D5FA2CB|nr:hypothetical protein [Mycobacterium sp.]HZA12569.1 hypothetical protein [Mycobacterium sp.]
MPDDLLRYLGAPAAYSSWWLVLGAAMLAAVMACAAGVYVWTLPTESLRRIPLIRTVHGRLIRRWFAGSIRAARDDYRAGKLSAAQTAAVIRRTLRSFLALTTNSMAHFMHVADMTDSDLAPAAPLFCALNDAQFNGASGVDVDGVGRDAEELIRSWS